MERIMVKQISVWLPPELIEKLDQLVKEGLYPSRNEAIRMAITDMLRVEIVWRVLVSDRLLREIQGRHT